MMVWMDFLTNYASTSTAVNVGSEAQPSTADMSLAAVQCPCGGAAGALTSVSARAGGTR
jgi:hypothetical protein